MSSLLPPSATDLERALEGVCLTEIKIETGAYSKASDVPTEYLDFAAHAQNVLHYSSDWSESEKRAALAASFRVHQIRGTAAAVRQALGVFSVTASIRPWYLTGGAPHTFEIDVFAEGSTNDAQPLLTPRLRELCKQAIDSAKRLSQHYTFGTGHRSSFAINAGVVRRRASWHSLQGLEL